MTITRKEKEIIIEEDIEVVEEDTEEEVEKII